MPPLEPLDFLRLDFDPAGLFGAGVPAGVADGRIRDRDGLVVAYLAGRYPYGPIFFVQSLALSATAAA